MKSLIVVYAFGMASLSFAQNSQLRYEGQIEGAGLSGTLMNQQFKVSLRRPDSCGGNLGGVTWNTNSIQMTDGVFTLTPDFNSVSLASAMNPNNDFGASCSTPYVAREMVVEWYNGAAWETFYVPLSDAPRANYAFKSQGTETIGSVKVNPIMTCTAGQYLRYDPSGSQLTCSSIVPTDITNLNASTVTTGTLSSTVLPPLSGDIAGSVSATMVEKIRGVNVSATSPSTGQVLKFDGSQWAPTNESGSTVGDASYVAKGLVQINTDQSTSGLYINNGVLALPNTIAPGSPIGGPQTIPRITYDEKGRLTSVDPITVNDTSKLPLSGGSMTGSINMGTQSITNAANITATQVSTRDMVLNDDDSSNTITIKAPTNVTPNYTLTLPSVKGTSGQVLALDSSGNFEWLTPGVAGSGLQALGGQTGNIQTFASTVDNTKTTPEISSATDVHTLRYPMAVATGVAAGLISKTEYDSFAAKLTEVTSTNGYLTVDSSNPAAPALTVNVGTGANTVAAGDDSRITGALQVADYAIDLADVATCAGDEKPSWNTLQDKWECIAITGFLTDATAFVQNGNSFGTDAVLGTNDNSKLHFETNDITRMIILNDGRVGVGTINPTMSLSIGDGSSTDGSIIAKGYGTVGTDGATLTEGGPGTRMIWYPKKAAFRAGHVVSTQWNDSFIGQYSAAMGLNTKASGPYSFAMGENTDAQQPHSFAIGYGTISAGESSVAMGSMARSDGAKSVALGHGVIADSFAQVTVGSYNQSPAPPPNLLSWVLTDPLFVIGNGTSPGDRSNAMTVLKNGNTGIGITNPETKLQVDGVISPAPDNTHTLGTSSNRFTEVYATNSVINTSDRRMKKEIYDTDLGLDFINKLHPVSYRWNTGADQDIHYGLMAQDVEQVLRDFRQDNQTTSIVIHDKKTDRYGMRYTELISPLIKAVQELYSRFIGLDRDLASIKSAMADKSEIEALKAENTAKEQRIRELESKANELEAVKTYLCEKDPGASICKPFISFP